MPLRPPSVLRPCRRRRRLLAGLAGAIALPGCAVRGPDALRATRVDYNAAIQQTAAQELLLNLVRLRHDDPVYFMQVERISAEWSFERPPALLQWSAQRGLGLAGLAGELAAPGVSEVPTVYYVPLDGEVFARRVMAPLALDMLALVIDSGVPVDRVLGLALHSINGLWNTAADPGRDTAEAAGFQETLRALRTLQRQGIGAIGRASADDPRLLVRLPRVDDATADTPAARVRALLGLDPAREDFELIAGSGTGRERPGRIELHTRSLYAVMRSLAAGVPAAGRDRPDPVDPFGLQVRALDRAPADALVAVRHRGRWYGIDRSDAASRETFSLLSLLLRLQTGNAGAAAGAPVLSVGR